MATLVLDNWLERRLISRRRRLGLDHWDEVWEGVYVMAPPGDIEHFSTNTNFTTVLTLVVEWTGLGHVYSGVAISDRKEGWKKNFRVPDVCVFLNCNPAEDCGTHWCGGPDLAIEVVSPRDRTRKKIPFYEKIGTRELLIVDRRPWRLTLLRLGERRLIEVGQSTLEENNVLVSEVVPLRFQLRRPGDRPSILLKHLGDGREWPVSTRQ